MVDEKLIKNVPGGATRSSQMLNLLIVDIEFGELPSIICADGEGIVVMLPEDLMIREKPRNLEKE